jgi:predicted  nucleic acid-binding Zn-ribbon protein
LKQARSSLESEDKQIEDKKKELAKKLERAKAALPVVEQKRSEIIPKVRPDALENYQWLQSKLGAKVLTRLIDETCQSCFRKVPSQMYNEVLAGNNLLTCPGCNRIMVYRETEFLSNDKEFEF